MRWCWTESYIDCGADRGTLLSVKEGGSICEGTGKRVDERKMPARE